MIRTNLSTRPFYNEQAVQFWLLLLLLIVATATFFNVWRILHYSQSDSALATQATATQRRRARHGRPPPNSARASMRDRWHWCRSKRARPTT